jgi:hypothetical protein
MERQRMQSPMYRIFSESSGGQNPPSPQPE